MSIILFAVFNFVYVKSAYAVVSINEFLPDSDTEWIELYNSSSSADYLKSYYLDDDTDFEHDVGSGKKSLANINIDNISFPVFETSSFLNNSGDFVVLFDGSGNIVDQYQYTRSPGRDVSIGRYPDGSGSFGILTALSKASVNAAPASPTPSQTPTAAPIATPAKSPKPTNTPASTSIPQTSSPTTLPFPATYSPNPNVVATIKSPPQKDSTTPGIILGISADNTAPGPSPKVQMESEEETKIKVISLVLAASGVVLIILGILSTVKTLKINEAENDI